MMDKTRLQASRRDRKRLVVPTAAVLDKSGARKNNGAQLVGELRRNKQELVGVRRDAR